MVPEVNPKAAEWWLRFKRLERPHPRLWPRAVFHAARLATLRVKAKRARRLPGVTIVIVNFNTQQYLRTTLSAIRHFSPKTVQILVVDNHSNDESHAFLRATRDVRTVRLPYNADHGPALDVGFLLVRTEFAVAMDVDAFPISHQWLSTLLRPLESGYVVSGVHHWGRFAHPCCLAMRTRDFVEKHHTFSPKRGPGKYGVDRWDVAQLISMRERDRVFLIEKSEARGPHSPLGSVYGGIVYHNWFSVSSYPVGDALERVSRDEVLRAWQEAKAKHLANILEGESCARQSVEMESIWESSIGQA